MGRNNLILQKTQDHGIEKALDNILLEKAKPTLEQKEPVRFSII
jgi:glutamate synthase domain-containing protein 3